VFRKTSAGFPNFGATKFVKPACDTGFLPGVKQISPYNANTIGYNTRVYPLTFGDNYPGSFLKKNAVFNPHKQKLWKKYLKMGNPVNVVL